MRFRPGQAVCRFAVAAALALTPALASAQGWEGSEQRAFVSNGTGNAVAIVECHGGNQLALRLVLIGQTGWRDGGFSTGAVVDIDGTQFLMSVTGGEGSFLLSNLSYARDSETKIGVSDALISALKSGVRMTLMGPQAAAMSRESKTFALAGSAEAIDGMNC